MDDSTPAQTWEVHLTDGSRRTISGVRFLESSDSEYRFHDRARDLIAAFPKAGVFMVRKTAR